MRLAAGIFLAAAAWAAATVDAPSVGYVRSGDGSILRIGGIAGAFVTTATGQSGATSCAFSGTLGFIKLDTSVQVLDSTTDAPAGPALFGFNRTGDAGVAWYPAAQSLAVFANGVWTPVPFAPASGSIVAVALKDSGSIYAVLRTRELSILTVRISDGAIEDAAPVGPGHGPAFASADGTLLFVRDGALILRDAAGQQRTLASPIDAVSMTQMGAAWVHIGTATGPSLAVRLASEPRIFELPEISR